MDAPIEAKAIPASGRSRSSYVAPMALAIVGALVVLVSVGHIITTIESTMGDFDDFTPYWNGAKSVAAGHSPYEWLAENRPQEVPDYIYPPLLALVLAPFTLVLDYPTARWVWLGISTLFVAASVPLIWRAGGL